MDQAETAHGALTFSIRPHGWWEILVFWDGFLHGIVTGEPEFVGWNHETLVIDRMQIFHFLAYCNLSDTFGLSNNLQYKLCNYISRVNWSLMLRHTKLTEFQLSTQTWNSKLVPSTAANSACDASQVCWTSTTQKHWTKAAEDWPENFSELMVCP